MTTLGKVVAGFFEEPTTYRHDFCSYSSTLRAARESSKKHPADGFAVANLSPGRSKSPKTITSNDTLQQLDYKSRLPFNAMLKPKEIVGTNPQQTFCRRVFKDEGLEEAIKTRPRQYTSPQISLDDVKDRNTRKLMVDFTYTTTTSRAGKDTWSGFQPSEPCLPNTVFEKTVDPLALRLELLPDIPAGFEAAARKWDSIQERYQIDAAGHLSKSRKNIDHETSYQTDLVTAEEKDAVRTLIKKNELRLPYDRMPASYGGFRPQFGIEVPLGAKEASPFDPSLSVARAITARLSASLKS